jgi:putative peptidoglycan lipid II flippase
LKIVLSGYYGFDNAGDEALLAAITSSIKNLEPRAEFVVFSGSPRRTFLLHKIKAVYYMNPLLVVWHLLTSDLLISGGGSIFQDITSSRSLPYYISIVALAKLMGKPVIFYAQGVGPIDRPFSRWLMRLIANRVDLITLRDEQSAELLQEIGVIRPPLIITADPVFYLTAPDEASESLQPLLQELGGKPLLGVAVRKWLPLEGYQEKLALVLDNLAWRGYQIIFIPMAYPEDVPESRRVAEYMREPAAIIDLPLSSDDHLALISRLDFMIGMRLHALIFAANTGVTFAGISYDPKIDAFLKVFDLLPLSSEPEIMLQEVGVLLEDQQLQEQMRHKADHLCRQSADNARLALSLLKESPLPAEPVEENEPQVGIQEQETGKTFIGVSVVIFLAKLLGFVREIVFASIFGTNIITDIFQTIFSLPNLLFSSIGTALSAINIPNLTYYITHCSREERNRYISRLYAQVTLWGTIITLLGIIIAPTLARLLAPGIEGEAAKIAVLLTRIMLPTFLFVSLTFVTTGILQVHSHFLRAASISIPFNILILLALFYKGADIVFISYMITIGWLLQFLIQLPVLVKEKYKISWLDFKENRTVKMLKQLFPVLLGNSLLQLCLIVDRTYGTHLDEGTTAALAFGSNLFVTITSVFIVAMTSVVFPRLSQYSLEKDFVQIRSMLKNIFKTLLFILIPYIIVVVLYNQEIISLVYERGAFTRESTIMTATAFLFYSLAVIGYACQEIFNRVFYALKNYTVPMTVSIICLTINILLNWSLLKYGIIALSASTALVMNLYALITGFMVTRKIGNFFDRDFWEFIAKLAIPGAGMIAIIIIFARLQNEGILLSFLLPATLSGLVYVVLSYLMKLTDEFNLRREAK